MRTKREKIIQDLEGKEYVQDSGRIYFKTLSGNIVSSEVSLFFKKKNELTEYFRDRPEAEKQRLIRENLAIGASPLEEDLSTIKMEVVYQSAFCTVLKFSNYPESWGEKDIMFKKSLTDARGNVLSDIEQESWNTAREREDPRIMEFARKIRDWLRGDKD